MNYLIAAAGLFSLAAPAPGADKPKPNTLTRQEIADGWLLLFDGETTFGWRVDGESKVESGALVLGGEKKTTAEFATEFAYRGFRLESTWEGKEPPVVRTWFGEGAITPLEGMKFGSLSLNSANPPYKGKPISVTVPAGSKVLLRNLKLLPATDKPLFNGKDLAGWKKYEGDPKRAKSQFTVTKEGWLHLQDGPGDLQTEGQWADFVLQLECRSNGKFLNSGAFFRCLPGQYQNGYEAQIHNNFTADPPKEYAVDVYDPKTHAKTGVRKVKSAAVDYGTGAIYRRIPARSGVAKDGEWFTMTVAAHGRHIATWVNGVQQVDWTDDRPPHENPRNGRRVGTGAISLQGHDPTTDLYFRNIRLAELPPAGK